MIASRDYSGGMKRRLNLAAALLHDPQILLLDEPTVGVDPQSRNAIFDNLEVLKGRGKTLLYTTHYMEEAERLCDRVVIMDHGKVVANDTLQGLYRMLPVTNLLAVELDNVARTASASTNCRPCQVSIQRNSKPARYGSVFRISATELRAFCNGWWSEAICTTTLRANAPIWKPFS